MTPIEALSDAIMTFEGWKFGSRSWRNRNPGNLRPYTSNQLSDNEGYRVFDSLAQGHQALLDDLAAKFGGSHGLTSQSTLLDLFNCYAPAGDANNPSQYTQFVCNWTSKVLNSPVEPSSTLAQFQALTG